MAPNPGDDRGALALAMLLTIVGAGLSVVLLSTVLHQIDDTRAETGRASALMAARTGLHSTLASLRAARDGDAGLLDLLPCPVVGASHLSGTFGPDAEYNVTIHYLVQDPNLHDEDWAREKGERCAADLEQLPRYAFISSTGRSHGKHPRTLTAVYKFQTAAQGNMPGGRLRIYRTAAATKDLCVDAGPIPTAGVPVTMQLCVETADGSAVDRQKFGYQPNSTISYEGGNVDEVRYPNGLCVQAGWP